MIGFGIDDFFMVHIFTLAVGHFNHSNLKVPLGPLKYVFNNPQMHIWHHAKHLPEGRKYGMNYGLTLSLWDYLFGTACIPSDGRDVELGFPGDERFPASLLGQLRIGLGWWPRER
jgi:sterol desaturase/sphingolipid hydroxylase (fatty acid hydroxylase superfamily)